MITIGIDIAKNKHDIHIVDATTHEVIVDHMTIANDRNGFESLLNIIQQYNQSDVLIGCEATGHYHFNICDFFSALDFNVFVLNAHDVKLYRDYKGHKRVKNDKIDCSIIAAVLADNPNLRKYSLSNSSINELRKLTRFRTKLVSKQTGLKIELTTLLDSAFPEYASFFKSGIHIPSSYAILNNFPTPKEICDVRVDRIANVLRKASKGKFGTTKARELKNLAARTSAQHSDSLSFEISILIDDLIHIKSQIKKVEQRIDDHLETIDSPITTIPGIANTLAAVIISEIGDINNYASASKLLAYTGLVPSQYQSGKYLADNNHITKFGNKYLRAAIWKAASLIYNRNDTFQYYYNMKRSQGKHHNVVIGHITKKLVSIIYSILKDNVAFVEQY